MYMDDDSTPSLTHQPDEKSKIEVGGPGGGKWMMVVWTVVAIIIAAGALYGTYYWQHKKVENDTAKVSSLNSQITSLNSQVKSLSSQLSSLKSSSTSGSSSGTTVTISQMGIQFTVPSSLSGLTYHYSATDPSGGGTISGETFADVSTTSLASQDPHCVADTNSDTAQGTALGMIVKVNGTPSTAKDIDGLVDTKQFSGFFVAFAGPQAYCSSNTSAQSSISELLPALQTAFGTVKQTGS